MLLFADGFDHYASLPQKWTFFSQAAISTSAARNGTNGCLIDAGGGIAKSLPPRTNLFIGFAYQVPIGSQFGGPLYTLGAILTGGGLATWIFVKIEDDGSISIYASGPGTLCGNTASNVPPFFLTQGVFYYIEINVTCGGSAPANITATLNVNTKTYLSAVTGNCNFNTSSLVLQTAQGNYHNLLSGTSVGVGYIDDLYINDDSSVAMAPNADTFRGDIRVGPFIVPIADSAIAWSGFPSSPPSWPLVSEIPPDGDTSYIFDNVVSDIDTFSFTTVPSFVGEIQAAHYCLFMKKDNEGTREISPIVGSSHELTPPAFLSDDYYYYTYPMDVDPTSGSPWTAAGINAQVFGAMIKT